MMADCGVKRVSTGRGRLLQEMGVFSDVASSIDKMSIVGALGNKSVTNVTSSSNGCNQKELEATGFGDHSLNGFINNGFSNKPTSSFANAMSGGTNQRVNETQFQSRNGGGDHQLQNEANRGGSCYNCGETGHNSRECSKPKNDSSYQSTSGSSYYNCTGAGQMSTDCPESRRPKENGSIGGSSCYNCGESGHMSKDCSAPRKPREGGSGGGSSCYNCGESGHMSKDCSAPRKPREGGSGGGSSCYNCGESGHMSKDCSAPRKPREGGSGGGSSCYNCGESGHMSKDCSAPRKPREGGSGGGSSCYNCGESGHMSKDCSAPRKPREGGSGGGSSCFNCGESGHMSKDCSAPRKPREGGSGGGSSCYNCGESGHMSKDCSAPRKPREGGSGGGSSCYNCGESGHMSKDCSAPRKPREGGSGDGNSCYNCGESGHMSKDCTAPRKAREPRADGTGGMTCFRCKQEGHFSKDCTQPALNEDGTPKPPIYIPAPPPESEAEIFQTLLKGINFDRYDDIKVECTGNNTPNKPMERFTEVGLSDVLLTNLRKTKYDKPTPVQKWAIPVILNGRDMMGCAQTGSGKTAAFLLPILNSMLGANFETIVRTAEGVVEPLAIIMAPTRELVIQIMHETRKFSYDTMIRAAVAYGGVSVSHQRAEIQRGVHIVIGTPGRLLDFLRNRIIGLSKVKFLILDEADRMLDCGFKTDIDSFGKDFGLPPPGARQTVLFSATIPEEVQKLASQLLNDYIFVTVGCVGGANLDIKQYVYNVGQDDKRDRLIKLIEEEGGQRMIIFVEKKRQADFLSNCLSSSQYPTTSIHGDLIQAEREAALRDFRAGRAKILVATNVAARGLDIADVMHVVNYDLPSDIEEYVHRIGRTGRCGNVGKATSFFVPEADSPLARPLVKVLSEAQQEIPDWLENISADYLGMGGFSRGGRGNFGARDARRDTFSRGGSRGGSHTESFNNDNGDSGVEAPSRKMVVDDEEGWD